MDKFARSLAAQTFASRAGMYEREAPWVGDRRTIEPLFHAADARTGLLLDVCAGTGICGKIGSSFGLTPVYLDVTVEMLARISDRGYRIVGDGGQLPFLAGQFSIAVCRQGLQYLPLAVTLAELARVTRTLALSHIVASDTEDVDVWRDFFRIVSPGRQHVFREGEIVEEANLVGFTRAWGGTVTTRSGLLASAWHLPEAAKWAALDILVRAGRSFARRYDISGSGLSMTSLQYWELSLLVS